MIDRERVRALIVDDQESMRELLSASLQNLGIKHPILAQDGVSALRQMKESEIDIVLLDAEMPRMSGEETLVAMRADEQLRHTPVIMVTGRANADFVKRMAQHGIAGYLLKPVSASALGARIDAALSKSA